MQVMKKSNHYISKTNNQTLLLNRLKLEDEIVLFALLQKVRTWHPFAQDG